MRHPASPDPQRALMRRGTCLGRRGIIRVTERRRQGRAATGQARYQETNATRFTGDNGAEE